ncbi:MAG: DNA-processing protein DprA [Chthonomonas sp.]|nr:DNA-processing protein DprA [Chthonomonas sp.]
MAASPEPSNRLLTIALALSRGIGAKSLVRIHTRNELLGRTPSEFLRLTPECLQEEYSVPKPAAVRWSDDCAQKLVEARDLLNRLDELNVDFATALDAHYPALLDQFATDPPGLLFFYGNSRLLEQKTFCVMASRKAPKAAADLIEERANERILRGEVLVTGHDTPEYQRSAVVPLRWGAPRILVLDSGFFKALGSDLKDEPFRAARLWRYQFDAKTDLAVSAVNPMGTFHPTANQRRDGIIAGLSLELDFAWVNEGGNMESLLKQAIKVGRRAAIADLNLDYRRWAQMGAEVITTAPR